MSDGADTRPPGRKSSAKDLFTGSLRGIEDQLREILLIWPRYVRDFDGVVPIEQDRPYLQWQEYVDPDEDELFRDLAQSFADDTLDDLRPDAGLSHDGTLKADFNDPHWGHSTGHLFGKVMIDDLSTLHDDLQVGLWGQEGSYDAFCRVNFLYDGSSDLKVAINRMSLKLKVPFEVPNEYAATGTARELDLLMSEGLPPGIPGQPDGQGFFFRDARQLLMVNEFRDGFLDALKVILKGADLRSFLYWKNVIFPQTVDMLYREPQTRTSWDQKWYYSAGPYALGNGIMKFGLKPSRQTMADAIPIDDDAMFAHAARFQEIRAQSEVLEFDLMVQVATPGSLKPSQAEDPPPCVMAAEYTDLAWDNTAAPFVRVGRVELQPYQVDASDPDLCWHKVGFNAWNTLHENRPLGQLFRARKVVHAAHRNARLRHSFGEPSANVPAGCPFAG